MKRVHQSIRRRAIGLSTEYQQKARGTSSIQPAVCKYSRRGCARDTKPPPISRMSTSSTSPPARRSAGRRQPSGWRQASLSLPTASTAAGVVSPSVGTRAGEWLGGGWGFEAADAGGGGGGAGRWWCRWWGGGVRGGCCTVRCDATSQRLLGKRAVQRRGARLCTVASVSRCVAGARPHHDLGAG